jgi:hypothetical protein
MVSAKTIAALEAHKIEYILGVREKRSVEIAAVLADKTPFVSLTVPKADGRGTLDLQVKEVVRKVKAAQGKTGRGRYIVCYNEAEARNDAAARAATLAGLEKALRQGDKALVGNKGFRRFLRTEGDSHFAIDPERLAAAAKFDGVYVIRLMHRSRRWLSRCDIANDGSWRISSEPRNPSSIRARSFINAMILFEAMCSAHSWLCCCVRNSSTVSRPQGVGTNGPISSATSISSFKPTSIKPAEGFAFALPLPAALAPCSKPSVWRCRR